jgi:hypothetical protein
MNTGQYDRSLNGHQLPIAMEVRRGRFLTSYEHLRPLSPHRPVQWKIPQPHKFVPSIYQAKAADYVKATQRVYCTPALPSHLVLPVVR